MNKKQLLKKKEKIETLINRNKNSIQRNTDKYILQLLEYEKDKLLLRLKETEQQLKK